jgi:protein-disulfide isomerase
VASEGQRKEQARAARLAAEAEEREQRKRKRLIQIAAIAGFAVIVVAAIIIATTLGGDDEEEAGTGGDRVELLLEGVPQEGTVLGDPDAPHTLTEFADLQCPFCAQFSNDVLPEVIDEFVRPGELKIDLQLLTFIGADSEEGARMALALAEQGRFWNFVDLFYANQEAENSGYVDEEFLSDLVEQIPGADFGQASEDQDSEEVESALADAEAAAQENGINSTPSFLLAKGNAQPEPLPVESLDPGDFVSALDGRISAGQ